MRTGALAAPAGAPPWFPEVLLNISQRFLEKFPSTPVQLASFPSTDLPDAVKYRGCLIYVSDTNFIAMSDGAFWYPLTKGAHY